MPQEIPMPNYVKLKPHFDALNIGGKHFDSMDKRDSQAMFDGAEEGTWDNESRQRVIYSEEIAELMKKHFPSQSVDDKQKRGDLLEEFFATRSWTKVENTRSEDLKFAFSKMKEKLEPVAEMPDIKD